MERVERADKDYVGRVQFFIGFAFIQQFPINQTLVETAAFGQIISGGVGALHLDIVHTAFFVFHIHIKTDAFAVQLEVDGLFEGLVMQGADFDPHNLFDEVGTKLFIAHHMLEEKVVTDGEFVKGFDPFH